MAKMPTRNPIEYLYKLDTCLTLLSQGASEENLEVIREAKTYLTRATKAFSQALEIING